MKRIRYFNIPWMLSIILWTGITAFITWKQVDIYQQQIIAQAKSEALGSYNKDLAYRRWIAKQGGIYVAMCDDTPPNPYLHHLPNRDITTEQGQKLTLINPAYMTRQVHELAAQQYGTQGHITSLKPLRSQNTPDEWERQCLETFTTDDSAIYSKEKIAGADYLRLMTPIKTEEPCLKCHGMQGYSVDDIRGGISVSVALAPHEAIYAQAFRGELMLNGLSWLIGIILLSVINWLYQDRFKQVNRAHLLVEISARKYRALFDEAENGYDLLDFNTGEIVECNQAFADLVGRPISELIGQSHTILHPPSHLRGNASESFVQVCNSPNGTLVVTQLITPDGIVRDVEIRGQKINIDGRTLVFGTFQDITTRKQLDDKLKRLLQAVEQSPFCRMLVNA